MKTLYTDASFDWTSTESAENYVRGKIAVAGDGIETVDKVAVGKVTGLKQYINVFELTAIARAVELAGEANSKGVKCETPEMCNHLGCHPETKLTIFTDSQTAMYWARKGKVNPKVETEAHINALEYLRKARIMFGGEVTFNHVGREQNPAGKLLERELEFESPHAI